MRGKPAIAGARYIAEMRVKALAGAERPSRRELTGRSFARRHPPSDFGFSASLSIRTAIPENLRNLLRFPPWYS